MESRQQPLLIYGATGASARLIVARALERGLPVVLSARDEAKLAPLADALRVPYRVARLDDAASLASALEGAGAVLHCAGPFEHTSEPMLRAALHAGVHYLDISGELAALERAALYDGAARARRCMIMPAVGFDVVPSDCLAVYVARALRRPVRLALGIFGLRRFTQGSARSMARQAGAPIWVRREGRLTGVAPGELRRTFELDGAPRAAVAVTWADVAAAFRSTGVPSIETYFEETGELSWALAASRMLHATGSGPLVAQALEPWLAAAGSAGSAPQDEGEAVIVAEACDAHGTRATALLRTPGPYACTALAAVAVAERVLCGDVEPGFETPARVYGPDFALGLPGVRREVPS